MAKTKERTSFRSVDIKRITKKYGKFFVHKFDSLDETSQLFERHNTPQFIQKKLKSE
jgi:hypothetical protein